MQPAMDPIRRMFKELEEENGAVRVRYSTAGQQDFREQEMTYREYRSWLDAAPKAGLQLQWVEQVRKPHHA